MFVWMVIRTLHEGEIEVLCAACSLPPVKSNTVADKGQYLRNGKWSLTAQATGSIQLVLLYDGSCSHSGVPTTRAGSYVRSYFCRSSLDQP